MSAARRPYPSDLSDADQALLAWLLGALTVVDTLSLDARATGAYIPPT
jgi:hypothetical protein